MVLDQNLIGRADDPDDQIGTIGPNPKVGSRNSRPEFKHVGGGVGAFVDRILPVPTCKAIGVVACTAHQRIVTNSADQDIFAGIGVNGIVASPASQSVRPGSAVEGNSGWR